MRTWLVIYKHWRITILKNNWKQEIILGLQIALSCFPATTVVALILGLSPSLALFAAGIATIAFALITQGKVPIFLGSSFAFLGGAAIILQRTGDSAYLGGATIVAGVAYLIYALIAKTIGIDKINKFLSPVIVGTMIVLIGTTLMPSALDNIGNTPINWLIAIITIAIIIAVQKFGKGLIQIIPIIIGVVAGYIVSAIVGVVDYSALHSAAWVSLPPVKLPKFDLSAILILLPLTLSTLLEHIGDVKTASNLVGQDFFTDPGIHRTLIGDGVGTMISGFVGFTPNTSYSEGLAVMELTGKAHVTYTIIAAITFFVCSFLGKISGFLLTIPSCVVGAASLVLYYMIASIGIKTYYREKVDFNNPKNLMIAAVMLFFGFSGITFEIGSVSLTGIALAAIIGIILNLTIKEEKNV